MAKKDDDSVLASYVADPLEDFEGRPVLNCGIEIRGAGGGLDETMKFEPNVMHHGEEFWVLLHCRMKGVRYDEIKNAEECLSRVQIGTVVEGCFADDGEAERIIGKRRKTLRVLREKATGQSQLAGMDNDPEDNEDNGGED